MPQGRPHFQLWLTLRLSFTKALVFRSCTAVLSAFDLTNPSASWETAYPPPLPGWDVPGTSSLQLAPAPSFDTWRSPLPSCSQIQPVSSLSMCWGPEPGLPQLDHGYETPWTKPASLGASGSHL